MPIDPLNSPLNKDLHKEADVLPAGTVVAPTVGMDCFFGTYELPNTHRDRLAAVVTFNIPELGIRFKAPFAGVNTDHCDFASLLALLEFIDSNQKYFKNQGYQIFGNNRRVIDQVNERSLAPPTFAPLMAKARAYRDKYGFALRWVPSGENSAYDELLH
jgi:hypothetical protein